MDLERERGITIKAHAVRLNYRADDGETYQLNLIDTPGHVDFSYEVSRSLQACEGALLVVDASQGVEAQTLANTYLALHHNLEIIPVINKIDLPAAEPERIREQIEKRDRAGCHATPCWSAPRQGIGMHEVLEAIVQRVPPPKGSPDAPLRALIFDSWFDPYRGVIILMRVIDGTHAHGTEDPAVVERAGVRSGRPRLSVAQADRRATNCRRAKSASCSPTSRPSPTPRSATPSPTTTTPPTEPLPGFEEIKPMVFAGPLPGGIARARPAARRARKAAAQRQRLHFEPENSVALGFGFRCGFLGLLHLEIVQERLEREFNLDLITTAPGVRYRITTTDGDVIEVDNPSKFPDPSEIEQIEEPIIDATVITREEYVGGILKLLEDKRGKQKKFEYIGGGRVMLVYELPLNEIVLDFYDRLKSVSRGYASLDYHLAGYRVSPMVKLDILVAGEPVDALSIIVHRTSPTSAARMLIERLRKLIPRQMFEVALQAAIGNKIIARETISGHAQERARQVLRRRHLAQTQAAGKAEGRQEAHEARRPRRDSAGSLPGGAQSKRGRHRGC